MATRCAILCLPAFPLTLRDLSPQREAAELAGALRNAGHWTQVFDYGTLGQIERFDTPVLRHSISRNDRRAGVRVLWNRASQERMAHVARELFRAFPLDVVFHYCRTRDEMVLCRGVAERLRLDSPNTVHALFGPYFTAHGAAALGGSSPFRCGARSHAPETFAELASSLEHESAWPEIPCLVQPHGVASDSAASSPEEFCEALYDPFVYPAMAGRGKLKLFAIGPHGLTSHAAREMRRLQRAHRAQGFVVEGTDACAAEVQDFLVAVMASRLRVRIAQQARPSALDQESLELMRQAGCRMLELYCPSGSQRLLSDFYHERTGVSHTEAVLHGAREQGFNTGLRMSYPAPLDDEHSREETFRILRRVRPQAVSIAPVEFSRHSPWSTNPAGFGFGDATSSYECWASGEALPKPAASRAAEDRHACHELLRTIASEGIAAGASCHDGLAARIVMPHLPAAEAMRRIVEWCDAGDIEALARLISDCNASGPSAALGGLQPFIPVLEAVGN